MGNYYIHFNCNDSNFRGAAFVTDENLIVTRANMTYGGGSDGNTKITLTEPSRIAFFAACGSSGSATITNLQVELGSSYTEWKPYNPLSRSILISIGQTVYGGTLDVISGVGEVTMASVDLGDLSWGLGSASTHTIFAGISGIKLRSNLLSDKYKFLGSYQGSSAVTATGIYSFTGYAGIGIRDDKFDVSTQAGIDAFAESLDGSVVVYELATPIPIQLTPQEVKQLVGENHVWSSAGDVTVEVVNATPIE